MGSGGGMNLGFSQGSQSNRASTGKMVEGMANQFNAKAAPIQGQLFEQLQALLAGGNSSMMLPLISSALDQTKSAGSQTMNQTSESLAQAGLAGTPLGEMIKAKTQAGVNQQNASAIPAAQMQMLNLLLPAFLQTQGQMISGLSSVTPGKTSSYAQGMKGGISYGG